MSPNVISFKENNHNCFFRNKALAAPSIDKTEKQLLLRGISLEMKFVSKSCQILENCQLQNYVQKRDEFLPKISSTVEKI